MNENLQDFVSTFQNLFPGVQVPPMSKEPGELGLSAEMAIRQSNPALWQRLFGGQGAPLPADIQQWLLNGQVFPEDAGALRAAHMDAYAAEADQHRQAIIDRAREATRAREKAIYEQQVQRSNEFRSMGLLGRMSASPVSERPAAQARAAWGISE